jgi:hypothetical protein
MKITLVLSLLVSMFSFSAFSAQSCNQEQMNNVCNTFNVGCDLSKPHNCTCEVVNGSPKTSLDTYCHMADGRKKTSSGIQPLIRKK